MYIDGMRLGDTIISVEGRGYIVTERHRDHVMARPDDIRQRKERRFDGDRLFCVDHDDGLWQETINRP